MTVTTAQFIPDAVATTYDDVSEDIRTTVTWFHRQYGGDLQELMADANTIFMRAYLTYNDRNKQSFPAWARFLTWKILMEGLRRRLMRSTRCPQVTTIETMFSTPAHQHRLVDLLDELSTEGQLVVWLVLDTPQELRFLLRERMDKRAERPSRDNWRKALWEYLEETVGWTRRRILRTFAEIGEELSKS